MLLSKSNVILGISSYAAEQWGLSSNGTISGDTVNISSINTKLAMDISSALALHTEYVPLNNSTYL